MGEKIPEQSMDALLEYHNQSVAISQMMSHPGFAVLMEVWAKKKERLKDRIERTETDIEVGGIEKKDDNITIVILNKDENKIKKAAIEMLEREFKAYQAEAAKPAEAQDE